MRAGEYTVATPHATPPTGPFMSRERRAEAIEDALDPLRLGDYDKKVIGALARLDDPTVRTVVSWLLRLRAMAEDAPPAGAG